MIEKDEQEKNYNIFLQQNFLSLELPRERHSKGTRACVCWTPFLCDPGQHRKTISPLRELPIVRPTSSFLKNPFRSCTIQNKLHEHDGKLRGVPFCRKILNFVHRESFCNFCLVLNQRSGSGIGDHHSESSQDVNLFFRTLFLNKITK